VWGSVIRRNEDGNESIFFDARERGANFLQARGLLSREAGVIGLSAICAGWAIDYRTLKKLVAAAQHEGEGPKHL
jgi:hypothetical protein